MENENVFFQFAAHNIPQPTESQNTSSTTFVRWGDYNTYCNYLLYLYSKSPIHSTIINQKASYIIGNGLMLNDKPVSLMVNPQDSLSTFLNQVVLDFLLFNSITIEVVKNKFGQPIRFYHKPVHKYRMNKENDLFFYHREWKGGGSRQYELNRYYPSISDTTDTELFYYSGYYPSEANVYPTPEYTAVISAIETDIAIQSFVLNNVKQHFSPASILTFFEGTNVSKEEQKKTRDRIKRNYTGENGFKTMITFADRDGKPVEVTNIGAGDWHLAFQEAYKTNIDTIVTGEQCQNGSLFAISQPGKLAGSTSSEMDSSYLQFKDNYIEVKREQLESALMQLFSQFEPLQGKLSFTDKDTFKPEMDKNLLLVLTVDEIREKNNYAPLPNGEGQRLLSDVNIPTAKPLPQTVSGQTGTVATQPSPTAPVEVKTEKKKSNNIRRLTEADFELVKHIGLSQEDFEVLEEMEVSKYHFSVESDIADYLTNHDIRNLNMGEVLDLLDKADIQTNAEEVGNVLEALHESGLADVTTDADGRIKVTPLPKAEVPDTDRVSVMYKYKKRPNVKGEELIEGSRGFCVKLINNNRLYTRADIQQMSDIFQYDIYTHQGGWWHDPETGETVNHCRHFWLPVRVKSKVKN